MFTRGETSKSRNTAIHNIHTNPEDYNIDFNSFGFNFVFMDLFTKQKFYDETYFKITVDQTNFEFNVSTGAINLTIESRDFSLWGDNLPDFGKAFKEASNAIKRSHYCTKNQNFTVRGSVLSSLTKIIQLSITKWVNGTSVIWKTPAQIEDRARRTRIILGITMSYLDFEDYNTPIKPTFDIRYTTSLVPGFFKSEDVLIKKSKVRLIDSFFQFGQSEEREFYSIGQTVSDLRLADSNSNELLQFTFKQDLAQEKYERRVFSIFDLTGNLEESMWFYSLQVDF